jgi:hypothetical protein
MPVPILEGGIGILGIGFDTFSKSQETNWL